MDLQPVDNRREGAQSNAAEPIYYLYGEDVKWWDEKTASPRIPAADEWTHPPRVPCIRGNIHRMNNTHIRSPFLSTRYPHTYKGSMFEAYCKMPSNDYKEAKPPGLEEECENTNRNTHRLNIELSPVKPKVGVAIPKKSLRERLRDGEVVFYEDYVEREIARDYCRLFGEPFNVPRHDWGGGNFFFGEHVCHDTPKETIEVIEEDEEVQKVTEVVEVPKGHRQVDALILADNELDPKKRQELLEGEIGSLFSTVPSSTVRQRHPKDRLVSFHHLKTYACMIDSVTKCPLIHVELQAALKQGWAPEQESAKMEAKQRSLSTADDPYVVTPEHIARANEILARRRKPKVEPSPKVNMLVSRRRVINKEAIQVGGGRYQV